MTFVTASLKLRKKTKTIVLKNKYNRQNRSYFIHSIYLIKTYENSILTLYHERIRYSLKRVSGKITCLIANAFFAFTNLHRHLIQNVWQRLASNSILVIPRPNVIIPTKTLYR